jgi:hypothetical protein
MGDLCVCACATNWVKHSYINCTVPFLTCVFFSALLLAYMKGNVTFCKALVRAGACLAATNKTGVSIFNYQLATKQLLVR